MNYSASIFLINDKVRAIAVTYEKIPLDQDTTKRKQNLPYLSEGQLPEGAYTFKTMDPSIKVNDYVVVPTNTRHGLTVCQVIATDVEVDFEAPYDFQWIVSKVDLEPFEKVRQEEAAAIAQIRRAQTMKRRKTLAADLMANVDEDAVKAIPMFSKEDETEPTDNGSASE